MAGASVEGVTSAPSAKRFAFRLAERADDAALRELIRATAMDGPVRVALCREPSYFDAAAVEGPLRQTLIVTDEQSGRIVGLGARSVRRRYVHGQPTPVGYLSSLRILPEYRGGTILARGYREMRRLHEDGAAEFYVTTIAEGNQQAAAALTQGRAGLPRYHPLEKYYTFVIPLRRSSSRETSRRVDDDLEIRPLSKDGRGDELSALIEFLNEVGPSRLFFPRYDVRDFRGPQATFRGLAADDVLTAWRGSRLVACLGLWNQMGFKQSVVCGYRWDLRAGRLAFNPLARCLGWPRFPPPGQALPAITAALPLAAEGQTQAFSALLEFALQQSRLTHPRCESLLVGVGENDPLFDVCRRASLFSYVTRIYVVHWDEQTFQPEQFGNQSTYLELGCL